MSSQSPAVASPPTWAHASEAVAVCLYRPNRRRVAAIASTVGTVLVGVNQGGALAAGRFGWVTWVRVALDYLIPTCVSTMGVLAGSRRSPDVASPGASDREAGRR
jgi:hypothetical protein